MTYTLGGQDLGQISSEESTKDAQLFQMPMPVSDSSDAVALDLFGASRNITIDGVYTSQMGTISTFISWLDGLVNGTQTPKTYSSDTSGTSYTVLVMSVKWKRDEAEVTKISYTITLMECANF